MNLEIKYRVSNVAATYANFVRRHFSASGDTCRRCRRRPATNRRHDLRDVPAFRGSRPVSLRTYYVGPYGSWTPGLPASPSRLSRSACLGGTGCSFVAPPPESPRPSPSAREEPLPGHAASPREVKTPPRRRKGSKKVSKPYFAPSAPFALLRDAPPLSGPL